MGILAQEEREFALPLPCFPIQAVGQCPPTLGTESTESSANLFRVFDPETPSLTCSEIMFYQLGIP